MKAWGMLVWLGVLLLIGSSQTRAQTLSWQQALTGRPEIISGATETTASAVDASGNILLAGTMLTNANSSTTSNGSTDVFVAQYHNRVTTAANGWARRDGGIYNDFGTALAVEGSRVYLAGSFQSFGSNLSSIAGTALTSAGDYDLFVARYTDTGTTLSNGWALRGGGTAEDLAYSLAVSNGNVYVGGRFNGTATIAGRSLTVARTGFTSMFVARYNDGVTTASNGWALTDGGDQTTALTVAGSTVYVGGTASSIAGSALTCTGNSRLFVARYTDGGTTATPGGARCDGAGTNITNLVCGLLVRGNTLFVSGSPGQYFSGSTGSFTLSGTPLNTVGQDAFVASYQLAGGGFADGGALSGGGPNYDRILGLTMLGTRLYAAGQLQPRATFGSIAIGQNVGYNSTNLLAEISTEPAPVLTGISPTSGPVGSTVVIAGTGLTGAASITFSGISGNAVTAGFTVNGAGTQITGIVVPGSATTGAVTVTTPNGASNAIIFNVTATQLSVTQGSTGYPSGGRPQPPLSAASRSTTA